MQLIGNLTKKLSVKDFDTQNGTNQSQEFIVKMEGSYPKDV